MRNEQWKEITTAYEVAHALGEPLNAIPYSQIFIAFYYPFDDADETLSLGAFPSEEAAYVALANRALEIMIDSGDIYDVWNENLPEDYELSEKENRDRAYAWALSRAPMDIISEVWDVETDIRIESAIVQETPRVGETIELLQKGH